MNSQPHVDESPSAPRRPTRIPAWKISLGGIAAATAVLVALGAGSASGSGTAVSVRENVASTSATSARTGDGQPDFDPPKPASTEFDGGAAGTLNPFDWAARLACRLVEEIDRGAKRTAERSSCDRWPARGEASGANDGPLCDELIGSELSERDLEDVVVAAFVFGLLADELDARESVQ